jgi:WD40 repeat protein
VQDSSGGLWKLNTDSDDGSKMLTGHAGKVSGLDVSPVDHFAATAGADGTVRCWDYVGRSILFTARHKQPASVLRWVPSSIDASGRVVVVGFVDGIVRLLFRAKSEWKRCVAVCTPRRLIVAVD